MLRELRLQVRKLLAGPWTLRLQEPQRPPARPALPAWRSVYETSPHGIALADADGRVIAANRALQALLGSSEDALCRGTLAQMLVPADRPALQAALEAVRAQPRGEGTALQPGVQARCQRCDGEGSAPWVHIRIRALETADGAPPALACHFDDITGWRRAEESARRLGSLLENSPDFIGIASMQGDMLFVNAAGRRMIGMDAAPSTALASVMDIIAPEDHDQYHHAIVPALHGTGVWEGETRFRHFGSGALVPMWSHAFVIRDPHGAAPAMATISRNLTERRRAQAELLALKDELAAELRAMQRLHDLSTRLLAPDGLQPLLEEILTCTIALQSADFGSVQLYNSDSGALEMVAHRNYPADFAARFAQVRDGTTPCGQAMLRRARVVAEDVRTDPCYAPNLAACEAVGLRAAHATPLFSRSGELLGVLSTQFRHPHRPSEHELRVTDLFTRQAAQLIERKRVEAALQRSEAYLAAAERLSHTGSWAWNAVHDEIYWSDGMFALFGRDRAAWKPSYGEAYASLHPDDRHHVRQAFEKAVQVRSEFQCEYRIVRPDGSLRHMRGVSHPVLDAQGHLLEYVGTVTDITERKRSEEALVQAHEELAHLTRVMSMGELAASVAHEINQPLAAIVTNGNAGLRWLARDPPDLHEVRTAVERIVRDGIRAGEVIGRIRAFTRKTPSHTTRLCLNEVVQQALALAGTELLRHQMALRLELAAALPPVRGDRIQLQQVVLNLMMNGIEAMQAIADRPRELVIRTYPGAAGQVVVAVQDGGIGLDHATAQRLFDAFFTTKSNGMGLGLAISRRIVEAHGGQVWAVRNDGPGTTVSFSVPA